MQLQEAVEPYLTYCTVEKQNLPESVEKYAECFKTWIIPHLGSKDLLKLDRLDVMALRKVMVDKNLGGYRQYSIVMTLKSFLRFCRDVIRLDCLNPDQIKLPDRGKPNVLVLNAEEIRKLLDAINPRIFAGARLRALIELLLATGMRISEALSLNRQIFDVDLDDTKINGKGNKTRTVFFNERCKFWIKNFIDKRFDDHQAVFVTTGAFPRRLRRDDISRFFIRLRQKAGVEKKVTPHVLRHTYCTTLLNNGADIMFIKELVGHADIQTTARYYLGVDNVQLRKVVDKYLNYELEPKEKPLSTRLGG